MAFKVRLDLNRAVSVTLVTGYDKTRPGNYSTKEVILLPGAKVPDNVDPFIIERWNAGDRALRAILEVDEDGVPESPFAPKAEQAAPEPEPEAQTTATTDYSSLTNDQLAQLADERGLDVKRLDGSDGKPRKEDYVAALKAADAAPVNPFGAVA